jgi:GR25 family glycosyltransferase involved in LPS biosynthesis
MNNQFLDIYVINLDKDEDRLKKITGDLFPNKVTRIKGIYGKNYDFSNNKEVFFTSRYLVPKPIIGSALSHRLALKTFLDASKSSYALILEDDAEPLDKNYIENIENIIKSAPANWDMIKLDSQIDLCVKENELLSKCEYSNLTTAIIVTKECCKKILDHKIIWYYDNDINFYGLNIYTSNKKIFKQTWDEHNDSNNRNKSFYPGSNGALELLNFKIIRIGDIDFSWNDIIYFLLFLILLYLVNRYSLMKKTTEVVKGLLSISKTK